jgi:hypothetical protein
VRPLTQSSHPPARPDLYDWGVSLRDETLFTLLQYYGRCCSSRMSHFLLTIVRVRVSFGARKRVVCVVDPLVSFRRVLE